MKIQQIHNGYGRSCRESTQLKTEEDLNLKKLKSLWKMIRQKMKRKFYKYCYKR